MVLLPLLGLGLGLGLGVITTLGLAEFAFRSELQLLFCALRLTICQQFGTVRRS